MTHEQRESHLAANRKLLVIAIECDSPDLVQHWSHSQILDADLVLTIIGLQNDKVLVMTHRL